MTIFDAFPWWTFGALIGLFVKALPLLFILMPLLTIIGALLPRN